MIELETRLTDALAALSAQWEADQHQQAEEQEMVNARIDDLVQLSATPRTRHRNRMACAESMGGDASVLRLHVFAAH